MEKKDGSIKKPYDYGKKQTNSIMQMKEHITFITFIFNEKGVSFNNVTE